MLVIDYYHWYELSFLKASSDNPNEVLAKIDSEQAEMHRRMVTEDGHLLIQLARCCVEDPKSIERKFPKVSKDIGPILRNLDKQVTTLIADTPIITESGPTPKYSAWQKPWKCGVTILLSLL